MVTDITWNEFCELYYENARCNAEMHLGRIRGKIGGFDKRVDVDFVIDSAVLSGLEKTYRNYDCTRGVKITSYLSTIVHNELVDVLEKETGEASKKAEIEDFRQSVKEFGEDMSDEARLKLLVKLTDAISLLSASDQLILNNYLDDKSGYVAASAAALGISENYVSVRRKRIFEMLPKLMNVTRKQYQMYYSLDNVALSSAFRTSALPNFVSGAGNNEGAFNFLAPSLSPRLIAAKLLNSLS